jgi:predicted Zn-dependent peptidase
MTHPIPDPETTVTTLANGVRVVTIALPHIESACVSVFVRTGSGHESLKLNGISHVVEHMAFKGTQSRDCQKINLDAERLGAEVNAHTDKDHTAYHMRGLARDAGVFLHQLADIVLNSSFPEAELERERQVILHELTEDEDDAMSTAFKLFDKLCYGGHPLAQPVIGNRANIKRFNRADLMAYVASQYSGDNLIVAVAGNIVPAAIVAQAQDAFGALPRGQANVISAPTYLGGVASRRLSGCPQTHVVVGFAIPSLAEDHAASVVAAALLGEGMSSPLMDQIRERRGLVYYAACSADVLPLCGQFVIEASTSPEQLDEFFTEVTRLLAAQAGKIDPVDLERARNQITVRRLRTLEKPFRRLEDAAMDLYVHGRVRSRVEVAAAIAAVDAERIRAEFARMLSTPVSVALAGKVAAGATDKAKAAFAALRR